MMTQFICADHDQVMFTIEIGGPPTFVRECMDQCPDSEMPPYGGFVGSEADHAECQHCDWTVVGVWTLNDALEHRDATGHVHIRSTGSHRG